MNAAAVAAGIAVLGKALPLKILLVDDDDLELELMAGRLASAGFVITRAKNGQEALSIFEQQWFPVVLTDWHMPLMDGMALTEQLRKRGHDETYIIMLSGRDDGAAYERGYFAGIDDYLSKQLPDQELLSRIEAGFRTLSLRRSLKQARAALEESNTTDADSDAYSMPHLIKQLNSEIKRSQRYNRNLSTLVLQFKDGRDVSSARSERSVLAPDMLQSLARALRDSIRQHIDWIARYHGDAGHDSFAVVLPETGPAEVALVRQRLRAVIERIRTDSAGQAAGIVYSIGAASLNLQGGNSRLDAQTILRVAQLCCQCSEAPENHLRAVQASVEAGVLIPCRLGYAISPYCQGGD